MVFTLVSFYAFSCQYFIFWVHYQVKCLSLTLPYIFPTKNCSLSQIFKVDGKLFCSSFFLFFFLSTRSCFYNNIGLFYGQFGGVSWDFVVTWRSLRSLCWKKVNEFFFKDSFLSTISKPAVIKNMWLCVWNKQIMENFNRIPSF